MKWDCLAMLAVLSLAFFLSKLMHDQWKNGIVVGLMIASAASMFGTAIRRSRGSSS